jgi:hypothetical protein
VIGNDEAPALRRNIFKTVRLHTEIVFIKEFTGTHKRPYSIDIKTPGIIAETSDLIREALEELFGFLRLCYFLYEVGDRHGDEYYRGLMIKHRK